MEIDLLNTRTMILRYNTSVFYFKRTKWTAN